MAALGIASPSSANGATHLLSLSDPVNALVSVTDHAGQRQILAATNSGLFRTSDPALGWDRVPYGPGFDVRTTCISTSSQDPSLILVGTTTSGVLSSKDGGQNWQQLEGV